MGINCRNLVSFSAIWSDFILKTNFMFTHINNSWSYKMHSGIKSITDFEVINLNNFGLVGAQQLQQHFFRFAFTFFARLQNCIINCNYILFDTIYNESKYCLICKLIFLRKVSEEISLSRIKYANRNWSVDAMRQPQTLHNVRSRWTEANI